MENNLKYKEYLGSVEYSAEDSVLYGKIIGINDLVTYQASSVKELEESFKEAVEDYLELCEDIGKEPNKLFKGSFNVRTSRHVHKSLAIMAARKKMKLNELVNKAFDYLVQNEDKVLN